MRLWILLWASLLPASVLADAGKQGAPCQEDSLLSRAAGELLVAGVAPKDDALARAVREAGSDLVLVRALYTPAGAAPSVERFLADAAARADAPLVCGQAQSDRARLWLVAARGGQIELRPGEVPFVRGKLAPGFTRPALVIEDGRGGLERIELDEAALEQGMSLSPDAPRPLRVQLIARGKLGPRPLAERELRESTDGAQPEPAAAPDLEPASQLKLLRAEARVGSLREHALLARVAEQHAKDVCTSGRVAHALEPGRDPEARVREAGVSARRVGETIARDLGAREAFGRMLHSPSHRATLLEPSFTDVGLGVAHDAVGRACVVVLLASWPRFVATKPL